MMTPRRFFSLQASLCRPAFALTLLVGQPGMASAAGIYEDGASARAQSLGGAVVAGSSSPMDALTTNPAELARLRRPELETGVDAVLGEADFRNSVNDRAEMNDTGFKPKGALAYPVGPVTLGIGFVPESALRADWRYQDAPGGLDGATSYGSRVHRSEILVTRFGFAAGYAITPQLAVGATLGIIYNRNQLHAPYTIQAQPQLAGAKVLLDLDTEGWGTNATFGATWDPTKTLQIGVSYTLQSRIRADGRAHADAGQQLKNLGLANVDATSDFDAEVTNTFPQIVSAGAAWKALPRLTVIGQVDWIEWQQAFQTLDVRLRSSDNETYKGLLLGKENLDDDVPLKWRNQWVFRTGLEYALSPEWTARAGYRYGRNPVPDETVTPLNAAISEHVVGAGLGYANDRVSVDLSWQWQLPSEARVDNSLLLGGEYSRSEIEVQMHSVALTTRVRF